MSIVFTIRTEILPFDPQAGMKSEQSLRVDFARRKVTSTFRTGVTSIGSVSLSAVRNNFKVLSVAFSGTTASFRAVGQTASGVGFMPDIDYDMTFEVNSSGSGNVRGSHDGYPAYFVRKDGRLVHHFRHRSAQLHRLFGSRDVTFGPNSF